MADLPQASQKTQADDLLHQQIAKALGISLEEWREHLAQAEAKQAAGEPVTEPVTDEERAAFRDWLLASENEDPGA